MDIDFLRKEINKINNNIIDLLSERQKISVEIAKYKLKNNLPITNKNREKIVLTSVVSKAAELDLDIDIVKEIFVKIIKLSKKAQKDFVKKKNQN